MTAPGPWEQKPLASPRPPLRLVLLWTINAVTLTGVMVEQPILGAVAIVATAVISLSFLHWKYQRILVPARVVADAFIGKGAVGAAMRDLAEAIFRWDKA